MIDINVRIETDARNVKDDEITMAIPCTPLNKFLVIKKTNKAREYGKCPICNSNIYIECTGWCGHK